LHQAIASPDLIFAEKDGLLAVEAEHFYKQSKSDVRRWYRYSPREIPSFRPDPDGPHINRASNNSYLEILPDTRATHDDKLIKGENFMSTPGEMAVLHYKVYINQPGRYYVWVRTFATGSEDNGLHVGIDGTWPEHGQRMQWTTRDRWFWNNKQRTQQVHVGVPMEIYLDIEEAGEHEIMFSMREDGFEFDKFMLARDPEFRPEQNQGPEPILHAGRLPAPFSPLAKSHESIIDQADGDGEVKIEGEHKQWHKISLVLDGPFARETNVDPNPFTDYRMNVRFTHESGSPSYEVPAYFAADGEAANSSAQSGTKWIAHLAPDKSGRWDYEITFHEGENIAIHDVPWASEKSPYHGLKG
ncbi:MAG: DUF5060 domain-containing protein, partial [Bacteroidota bacterium]